MDTNKKLSELVDSGFVSRSPLVGKTKEKGLADNLLNAIKAIGQGPDLGFSYFDDAEYENKNEMIHLDGSRISALQTKFHFAWRGLETPADDFVFFHEMSHKRMHEELPKWSSEDKDFMTALAILNKGPDPRREGNEKLIDVMQNRFMESYADMMAIHLSAKEFGDSPAKLAHFLAEMRNAKKEDQIHNVSFGIEAAARRFGDKEFSDRFVSDRSFAEAVALRVATMNCIALTKDSKAEIKKEGSFGKELSEMRSHPIDVSVPPLLLVNIAPKQPDMSDVSKRLGAIHDPKQSSPKDVPPKP